MKAIGKVVYYVNAENAKIHTVAYCMNCKIKRQCDRYAGQVHGIVECLKIKKGA